MTRTHGLKVMKNTGPVLLAQGLMVQLRQPPQLDPMRQVLRIASVAKKHAVRLVSQVMKLGK